MDLTAIRSYLPTSFTSCFTQIAAFVPEKYKKYFFETTLKVMTLWTAKSKEWFPYTLPWAVASTSLCLLLMYKNRRLAQEGTQLEQRVEKLLKENKELSLFKNSIDQENANARKGVVNFEKRINLRLLEQRSLSEANQLDQRFLRLADSVGTSSTPVKSRVTPKKIRLDRQPTPLIIGFEQRKALIEQSKSLLTFQDESPPLSTTTKRSLKKKKVTPKPKRLKSNSSTLNLQQGVGRTSLPLTNHDTALSAEPTTS